MAARTMFHKSDRWVDKFSGKIRREALVSVINHITSKLESFGYISLRVCIFTNHLMFLFCSAAGFVCTLC